MALDTHVSFPFIDRGDAICERLRVIGDYLAGWMDSGGNDELVTVMLINQSDSQATDIRGLCGLSQ